MRRTLLVILAAILTAASPELSLRQQPLTESTSDSRAPAWGPRGDVLVFESNRAGNWDLFTMRPDGSGVTQLTSSWADDRFPAWDPSGTSIVFVSSQDGMRDLFILDVGSKTTRRLTNSDVEESFPSWSPDGTLIAFTAPSKIGALNLFTIRADGTGLRQLTDESTRVVFPRWSPTGDRIAFFSRKDTSGLDDEIYVMDLTTGAALRLTETGGHDFSPTWSADGRHLAIVSLDPAAGRVLRLIDSKGAEVLRIETPDRVVDPAMSPDGARIAFAAAAGKHLAIFVRDLPDVARATKAKIPGR